METIIKEEVKTIASKVQIRTELLTFLKKAKSKDKLLNFYHVQE